MNRPREFQGMWSAALMSLWLLAMSLVFAVGFGRSFWGEHGARLHEIIRQMLLRRPL